jgi:RNA polymerase sigma-70 factor, ECF subfamily
LAAKISLEKEKLLVLKAKSSVEAFGRLYDLYVDDIFRYVFYRIGSSEDAEDITALVFEKALKTIKSFEWQGFRYSAFLYKVAHNLIIDKYKKVKESISIENLDFEIQDETEGEQLDIATDSINIGKLHKAIGELSDEQREVVYLRYIKELSIQETMDITGKTIDSVKSLAKRGLEKLKELFNDNKTIGEN